MGGDVEGELGENGELDVVRAEGEVEVGLEGEGDGVD